MILQGIFIFGIQCSGSALVVKPHPHFTAPHVSARLEKIDLVCVEARHGYRLDAVWRSDTTSGKDKLGENSKLDDDPN